MHNIQINTTQNVALQFPLAGVGSRIGAQLLDHLFLGLFALGLSLLFDYIGMQSFVLPVLLVLLIFLYHLLCELFLNGQSFGKKLLKIKVVRLDGQKPSVGDYLLRWITLPLDLYLMSGAVAVIAVVVTEKEQRLGDLLAGTTVVSLNKKRVSSVRQLHRANKLPDDYQPTYPQAAYLSETELQLMRRCLLSLRRNRLLQPSELLAIKLSEKYNIDVDLQLPAKFLQTLGRDNTYYEQQKLEDIAQEE